MLENKVDSSLHWQAEGKVARKVEIMPTKSKTNVDCGKILHKLPMTFVAVDLETTGFSNDQNDIIEIAALKIKDGQIVDKFETLVNVGYGLKSEISELTGITDSMLENAPSIYAVIPKFENFAKDSLLLAHNASFDVDFLYCAYKKVLDKPLTNDYVDTISVARRVFTGSRTLSAMCKYLGVTNKSAHRAASDIAATVECYFLMRRIVIDEYGSEAEYEKTFNSKGSSSKVKAKEIIAKPEAIDENSPLFGKYCAFTGKITSMSKREAMQLLKNIGGEPQDSVTQQTDYLIIGGNSFNNKKQKRSKNIEKAEANRSKGINTQTISEGIFFELLEGR